MKAPLLPLAALGLLLPGASAAAGPPAQAPAPAGQVLFAARCAQCHDRAGWGTRALARRMPLTQAELLQRRAIPAALVKHVVRRGVGSMPPFTPTDLSDHELEQLAQWLETRR